MNAIVYERYGAPEQLRLARVARPAPGPGQILVRVEATSLNALDRRMLRADPFLVRLMNGLFRPRMRILGADVAGLVEAVGSGVPNRLVGERVFGESSNEGLGAFAEYLCLRASSVATLPAELDSLAAAALPIAAATALQAVQRARLCVGQTVLVHGAGGGVGGALVQIAKARGALVTAVCGPRSLASMHALGADYVVDRTRIETLGPDTRYDVVFGVNGSRALEQYLAWLVPGGIYVMVGGATRQMFEALLFGSLRARLRGRRATALILDAARVSRDLEEIRVLVARGALRPVVDRVVPLVQVVDAMRALEAGQVSGKIVLDVRGFASARA